MSTIPYFPNDSLDLPYLDSNNPNVRVRGKLDGINLEEQIIIIGTAHIPINKIPNATIEKSNGGLVLTITN